VKSHSLLELSQSVERVISRTFNSTYWVRAEISKLNFYPKSGHCYPELVEKQSGKVVAEIRSTIWRNTFQSLLIKFKSQTGEDLKEGMKILFSVQVKYSPTHGISLNIVDIDPSFTMGEIAKEKKQAIETLHKEGVFNQNHNLNFPYFPQRLAIISVSTSKGYQDFLETIENKAARFNITMQLFPAILQGDVAVKSITEQLELIQNRISEFDLVLIIRGGGGDVGLNCYNHINMARMVATFPIPVISGIGHSTNETVVEMVANTNKITPTAVADTLVDVFRDLENSLKEAHHLIGSIQEIKVSPQWQRLVNVIRFLKASSSEPLHNEKLRLQHLTSNLGQSSQVLIAKENSKLKLTIANKLQYLSLSKIKTSSYNLDFIQAKLQILDPKSVLKRGFSMTTVNGKTVTDIEAINVGDRIDTVLHNGTIESKIIKKTSHE
jgi:exodeoxyribonuclease VII large subunit